MSSLLSSPRLVCQPVVNDIEVTFVLAWTNCSVHVGWYIVILSWLQRRVTLNWQLKGLKRTKGEQPAARSCHVGNRSLDNVQYEARCPFDKKAARGQREMEKNDEEQRKTNESMDLLSLTFRSLELRDTTSQQEDFLDLDQGNRVELEETVTESRRRSWQNKEEQRRTSRDEQKLLKIVNLDEVAWHDTADNCWIVVHDFVYDCTDFLKNHPGGSDVILEYAGRDATLAFIGTGHSTAARLSLERYLIGELPPEERIFRVPNGVKIVEF